MGNTSSNEGLASVPVADRERLQQYLKKFDVDEMDMLQKIFRDLSNRTGGQYIDKETFLRYFPLPGMWGERLFQRFDFKNLGGIDFEEFLIGIAVCSRGTKDDKIHVLFEVFDLNGDGGIQKSELIAMLSNLSNSSRFLTLDAKHLSNKSLRRNGSGVFSTAARERLAASGAASSQGHTQRSARTPPSSTATTAQTAGGGKLNGGVSGSSGNIDCPRPAARLSFSDDEDREGEGGDVETLVNQILEECEFSESGQLNYLEFKTWLEHNDALLAMFNDSLHEEIWGLQGYALYRQNVLHRRDADSTSRRASWHNGESKELSPEQFYKIKRMFLKPKRVHGRHSSSGIRPRDPPQSLDDSATSDVPRNSDGSQDEADDEDSMMPKVSRHLVSSELLKVVQESHSNIDMSQFDSTTKIEARRHRDMSITQQQYAGEKLLAVPSVPAVAEAAKKDALVTMPFSREDSPSAMPTSSVLSPRLSLHQDHEAFGEELHCPACDKSLTPCPECNSRGGIALILHEGQAVVQCAACIDGGAKQFDKCWHCQLAFADAPNVLLADLDAPDREGTLYKKGKHSHQWRSRCYVLIDNLLYYYAKQGESKPKGVFFLEGCYVEELDPSHGGGGFATKYGFSICHPAEKYRRHDLYCNTLKDRDAWMVALRAGMKQMSIEQMYEILEQVGQGKFSIVYRAINRKSHQEYAIKVIDKSRISASERELLRSEMAIIRLLRHPHVIHLQDILDTKGYLYLVMELVKGGELYDLLVSMGRLTEIQVNRIVRQLLGTVLYLHNNCIVHRDLKPENILLTEKSPDGDMKITDFGLSTLISPQELLKQPCGTFAYVAPEVLTMEGYDQKVDMWSVGVIMYLLLRGQFPFPLRMPKLQPGQPRTLPHKHELKLSDEIWQEISPSAKDLIRQLLRKNKTKRISAKEAMEHLWIRNPAAVIAESSPLPHAPASPSEDVLGPEIDDDEDDEISSRQQRDRPATPPQRRYPQQESQHTATIASPHHTALSASSPLPPNHHQPLPHVLMDDNFTQAVAKPKTDDQNPSPLFSPLSNSNNQDITNRNSSDDQSEPSRPGKSKHSRSPNSTPPRTKTTPRSRRFKAPLNPSSPPSNRRRGEDNSIGAAKE